MKQKIKGLIITEDSNGKSVVCDWRKEKYIALAVIVSTFFVACWFAYVSQNYKPLPFLAGILAIPLLFWLMAKVEIIKKSDGSVFVTRRNTFSITNKLLIKSDQKPKILYKVERMPYIMYKLTMKNTAIGVYINYKNNLDQDAYFMLDNIWTPKYHRFTLSSEQAEEISKQLDLPLEIQE